MQSDSIFSKNQVLKEMRADCERTANDAVKMLYQACRKDFIGFLYKKFSGKFSIDALTDEYKNCISLFFERVVKNPDFKVAGPLQQYLNAVGSNRLLKQYEAMQKTQSLLPKKEEDTGFRGLSDNSPEPNRGDDLILLVYHLIDTELEAPLPEILDMFYVENLSYQEIHKNLVWDYPELTPNSIKQKKYRALKKIKIKLEGQLGRNHKG